MNRILVASMVAGLAGAAQAQLTFEFDEAAFAGGTNVFDDFSSYLTPSDADLAITAATQLGGFIYTPFGEPGTFGELELRSGDTAAENELFSFVESAPAFSFTITSANGPMNAFGFFIESGSSFGGTTVTLDNGETFDIGTFATSGDLEPDGTGFIGFTSASQFSTLTFSVTDGVNFEGLFIDRIYADVIPTPGAASLLAVAGLAAARRRR